MKKRTTETWSSVVYTEFLIEFVPDRRLTFEIIIIKLFDTNLYILLFHLQEVLEHIHCHGTAKVIVIPTVDTLHVFGSLKIHGAIVIYQRLNLIATFTIYKCKFSSHFLNLNIYMFVNFLVIFQTWK